MAWVLSAVAGGIVGLLVAGPLGAVVGAIGVPLVLVMIYGGSI